MNDINSCFKNLSDKNLDSSFNNLTDTSLVSCFENLVRRERKITAQVLECIGEIDKRKLYLEKGCTSLFDYLVKDFGYSPGAAMRRIDGARLLKELPEIGEKFESGTLTLSQATQVQRASRELKKTKNKVVQSNQKRELIHQIENLNQKETEQTLATLLDLTLIPAQKEVVHKNQSVTLTITLTAEQMQILEHAQNMISHSVPHKSWADTLTYLAQKEITRRTSNRPPKSITAATAAENQSNFKKPAGKTTLSTQDTQATSKRRALAARVRKKLIHPLAVCEYHDSKGRKCSNTRFLQIDHIQSLSRGGTNHIDNLQVLCGVHNRLKYQRESRAT